MPAPDVESRTEPALRPAGSQEILDTRYRLVELLDSNATSDRWRAQDLRLARPVTLELHHPDGADAAARTRALETLARVSHRGLVRFFDSGVVVDRRGVQRVYLVTEFVAGPTLRAAVARGPLTVAQAAAIGADVAGALDVLHTNGLVHGAVTADRVQVTDTGFGASAGHAKLAGLPGVTGAPADDVRDLGRLLPGLVADRSELDGRHRAPTAPRGTGGRWTRLIRSMTADEPSRRPTAADVATTLRSLSAAAEFPTAALGSVAARETVEHPQFLLRAFDEAETEPAVEPGRRRRFVPTGWLIAACVAVLAAVLGVALATHSSTAGPDGGTAPAAGSGATPSSSTTRAAAPRTPAPSSATARAAAPATGRSTPNAAVVAKESGAPSAAAPAPGGPGGPGRVPPGQAKKGKDGKGKPGK